MPTTAHVAEAGTGAPAATQWVVFRCADRRFGVPLESVTEIITPRPFTRLPGAGAEVCGLVGVRGRVVTVLDMGILLGLPASRLVADHRLLLLDVTGRRLGAAVDDVVAVAAARMEPLTATEPLRTSDAAAVLGAARSDDGVFTALDPVRLLAYLVRT